MGVYGIIWQSTARTARHGEDNMGARGKPLAPYKPTVPLRLGGTLLF